MRDQVAVSGCSGCVRHWIPHFVLVLVVSLAGLLRWDVLGAADTSLVCDQAHTWLTMTRVISPSPNAVEIGQRLTLLQWYSQGETPSDQILWSLQWDKESQGWLGEFWELAVSGVVADLRSAQQPSGPRSGTPDLSSIVLGYTQPQPSHRYQAIVSFHAATGTAAVQLIDLTDNDIVYSGSVQLPAVRTCCPRDPKTTDIRGVGVPFGTEWTVTQAGYLCGSAKPRPDELSKASAADRRLPLELTWHASNSMTDVTGELSLWLVTAEENVELARVPYSLTGHVTVAPKETLPAGRYPVELWFTDSGGGKWLLERDNLTLGRIAQHVTSWQARSGNGYLSLQGMLSLQLDGRFDQISAGITLTVADSVSGRQWQKVSQAPVVFHSVRPGTLSVPFAFLISAHSEKELAARISVSIATQPIVPVDEEEHLVMVSTAQTPVYTLSDSGEVVVHPIEYQQAFRNPLKGIRSLGLPISNPLSSLTKVYIPWNQLENSAADGVDKIIAYGQKTWGSLPHDVKVIPRVILQWGPNGEEKYWPADMTPDDYSSPVFLDRLVRLIGKLGQAWDKDPHVAYVEMGMIGWWGEQHHPNVSPALQQLMGDAFVKAFPNKRIMRRRADDFQTWPFGIYWDSFAHPNEMWHVPLIERLGDNWKVAPRGGEMAFDWGTPLGTSASDALLHHLPEIEQWIRRLHWNHLGFWPAPYDLTDPAQVAAAGELQKALGYRFVIREVRYPLEVSRGTLLKVEMTVVNTGSSPFYYDWPLQIYLLDSKDRRVVWQAEWPGIDIRSWLPAETAGSPAPENAITGTFLIPNTLPPEEYVLAVGITDPGWGEPAVRFAIVNHYSSNLCPLGKIGVDAVVKDPSLNAFDDIVTGAPHLVVETADQGEPEWR